MNADVYIRPKRDAACDRRRILMMLCAITVASYVWIQLRFPIQRLLAASSIGNYERADLIFDTFNAIHPSPPGEQTSALSYSSRAGDGRALLAICDSRFVAPAQNSTRHRFFDQSFAAVGTLHSNAQLASVAADRDRDGRLEIALTQYIVDANSAIVRSVWFVLRRSAGAWELIGLAEADFPQTATANIVPAWTAEPGAPAEWTFVRYTVGGAPGPATAEKLCSFTWSDPGGVLRPRSSHPSVRDCMPDDKPIPIADGAPTDSIIEKLVEDARKKLPRPLGSQPAVQTRPPSKPPPNASQPAPSSP